MRIRYFAGTDTLYIEFRSAAIAETRPGGHPNSPSCGHPKLPHLTRPERG